MTLIHIEDNKDIQEVFKTYLGPNHKLFQYDTITEVERHLGIAEPKIDGIITDDEVKDGSVVKDIKLLRDLTKKPIILITSGDFLEDDMKALGFTAYFRKPVSGKQIDEAMEVIKNG